MVLAFIDDSAARGSTALTGIGMPGATGLDIQHGALTTRGALTSTELDLVDASSVGDADVEFEVDVAGMSVASSLSIAPGASLGMGSSNLTVSGDFINGGSFSQDPAQVLTFDGSGNSTFDPGASPFQNVSINKGDPDVNSLTLTGNLLQVSGITELTSGTFELRADANFMQTVTILQNGRILNPADAPGLVFTFTAGAFVNDGRFHFFGPTSTLRFAPSSMLTIFVFLYNRPDAPLWIEGASTSAPVFLRSTSPDLTETARWNLNDFNLANLIRHVDVQSSSAFGLGPVVAIESIDSGNNVNWSFNGGGGPVFPPGPLPPSP
jgi:hypothetical protein